MRLGIGMISVLSSLVLGLLIATAKNSYDTTASAVRTYAAELALLTRRCATMAAIRRSRAITPSRCATTSGRPTARRRT